LFLRVTQMNQVMLIISCLLSGNAISFDYKIPSTLLLAKIPELNTSSPIPIDNAYAEGEHQPESILVQRSEEREERKLIEIQSQDQEIEKEMKMSEERARELRKMEEKEERKLLVEDEKIVLEEARKRRKEGKRKSQEHKSKTMLQAHQEILSF